MADRSWKEMFESSWKRKGTLFIQFLLDAGLDINALNKFGKSMLSYAAECGNLQFAEFLAHKGSDSNIVNSDGSKPLHIAAQYGRKDIVEYFLNTGVSADSCDDDESTPLHYVGHGSQCDKTSESRAHYQDIVHLLVNYNADLNAADRKGRTPLVLAAYYHRIHLVELFIELGANLEICDVDGYTVLHFAALFGWSGIVRFIVEGRFDFDLDARLSSGETPLLLAACQSQKKYIVDLLIEFGADVSCCCNKGWTVLHRSCEHDGWVDIVKYIVRTGCDLNGKNSDGYTPLVMAFENGNFYVVECLINESENNLDLESSNECEKTVLHWACEHGYKDIVGSLIEKGANLDAQSLSGYTPLHYNVHCYGHWDIAKLLLEAGADANLEDNFGNTAFHDYISCSHAIGLKVFIENGAFMQNNDYN